MRARSSRKHETPPDPRHRPRGPRRGPRPLQAAPPNRPRAPSPIEQAPAAPSGVDWTGPSVGVQLRLCRRVHLRFRRRRRGDGVLYGLRAYYDFDLGNVIVGGGPAITMPPTSTSAAQRRSGRSPASAPAPVSTSPTAGFTAPRASRMRTPATPPSATATAGSAVSVTRCWSGDGITIGAEVLYHEFSDFRRSRSDRRGGPPPRFRSISASEAASKTGARSAPRPSAAHVAAEGRHRPQPPQLVGAFRARAIAAGQQRVTHRLRSRANIGITRCRETDRGRRPSRSCGSQGRASPAPAPPAARHPPRRGPGLEPAVQCRPVPRLGARRLAADLEPEPPVRVTDRRQEVEVGLAPPPAPRSGSACLPTAGLRPPIPRPGRQSAGRPASPGAVSGGPPPPSPLSRERHDRPAADCHRPGSACRPPARPRGAPGHAHPPPPPAPLRRDASRVGRSRRPRGHAPQRLPLGRVNMGARADSAAPSSR